MGYCSDNPAMECLTVDTCSCALFERRNMRFLESDSHDGSQRNLQVDCSSISKSKDCGNAPGCQWNGRNGCQAAATLAPTSPPTSNPTNAPSNSPTSPPTPSVSFDFIALIVGLVQKCALLLL